MNLRTPKKKKKVKLKPSLPFPIPLNGTEEWPIYTAHLTDVGSCIIEPEEINAIHSMVKIYFIKLINCILAVIKNKFICRDFLVKDHYHAVILLLVKQGMEHHQLSETGNGFADNNG